MEKHAQTAKLLIPHVIAAGVAGIYAFYVSKTGLVTTGAQFVAPLGVVMAVHLGWLALTRRLQPGFSVQVARRSMHTVLGLVLAIGLTTIVFPTPAEASMEGIVGGVLGVVFCLLVVAAVGAVVGFLVLGAFRLIRGLVRHLHGSNGGPDSGPDTRLFDVGSLTLAFALLGAASLEGVPQAYRFATSGEAAATVLIASEPGHVWQVMERTAQPSFALPKVLHIFPQPVAVLVDEGSTFGARRQVEIAGREGAGILSLQVVERTPTRAVFAVLSDSSPIAGWVAHRRLIYDVVPQGAQTRVTVTLNYDRQLAPTWIFAPMIKGAAYLAMDVLARDIRARAGG